MVLMLPFWLVLVPVPRVCFFKLFLFYFFVCMSVFVSVFVLLFG